MPLLPRVSSFLSGRFRRARVERDLDDELESYVELVADEKTRAGVDPARARRQAWLSLGGKQSVKERVRERRIGYTFDTFHQDVAYGIRALVKSPGFALVVAATLALGIGATTAVFAVVDGVLFRSLPYAEPERLVFVGASARDGRQHFSPPDFVELREQSRTFAGLGALVGRGVATLSIDGEPMRARTREVTANLFSIYGVRPHLGRSFTAADRDFVSFEDRGNPELTLPTGVLMMSYGLWRERFGADPGVVGKLVELDLQPYQIIGVMPPEFRALIPDDGDYRERVDVWTLPRMDFSRMPRDVSFLRVVGRLRAETTLDEARAEAATFAARQRASHAIHREADYRIEVEPLHASLTRRHRSSIWMLFGAVGLLMLIACANLANLLLARCLAREHELAIRLTLGAGRMRLVRQLLTESALHAILGFVLAVPVAVWLTHVFVALAPATLPRAADVTVSAAVLGFALVAALVASSSVAFIPALRFARRGEASTLRTAGRTAAAHLESSWHRVFVVAEVALSVVLVIGTALLLKSLLALLAVEPGFRSEHVVTADISMSSRRYARYPRAESRVRFVSRASAAVGALPGVDAAGFALVVPLSEQDAGHTYATREMTESNRPLPPAKYRPVTPGYFDAVGTRLRAGREFTWRDVEEYRLVTIVDESLARKAWPGESAIGKQLRIEVWSTSTGAIHLEPLWTEVVGVAENVRSMRLGADDPETVYLPYGLYAVSELSLLVRSSSDPTALAEPIRAVIHDLDPDMAVFNQRVLDDVVADSLAPERFSLDLLGAFGATGLLLALIGLYGVLSHLVGLRRRELALRMALGARAPDVRRLVLARGVRLIGAGLVIGLVAAAGLTRLIAAELHDVNAVDGSVYAWVAAAVLVVGLAACYLPARRASKLDPMATLRLD